jgi:O-antigen ligase
MRTYGRWIIVCLAALAFLAPLKFGTPVVTQALMFVPQNLFDWVLESWPNQIAAMFIFGALLWLVLDPRRLEARIDLLFVLPLLFLATQALPTLHSINSQVSLDTLLHFACCVLVFYTAAWYVRDGADAAWIFGGLAMAVMLVCVAALRQYFGGLEETRQFASVYLNPTAVPKDFLLRMTSNRPFAWFGGYPNALAGFLVLAMVPTLAWTWVRARGWNTVVKWVALLGFGGLMVFCLVLTGSRGGFLAFGVMLVTTLLCLIPQGRRRVFTIVTAVVLLALLLFIGMRTGLITKGLSSFESRLDYWRGAVAIARDHTWLGTGPGTFGSIYPKYKTAQSEEAQLVHNNYLQMWSDSGALGFIIFAAMWAAAIKDSFRLTSQRRGDAAAIAVCAALTGSAVHSLIDFDLYVPGIAIPTFLLLGTLQGLKEVPAIKPVVVREKGQWLVGGLCVVVAALVIWVESLSLAAGFLHNRVYDQLHVNPWAALQDARQATHMAPLSAPFQATAGDVAVRLRLFDEAIDRYRTAIADDPYRASYHWRLGRVETAAHGLNDAVLQELRQATLLNPTNERYRQELADAEESVRQSPGGLLHSTPANGE